MGYFDKTPLYKIQLKAVRFEHSHPNLRDLLLGVHVALIYDFQTTLLVNDDLHIYQLISYYQIKVM